MSYLENELLDKNLFMMCQTLNHDALSELKRPFSVRTCRRDELEQWKMIHFDNIETARENKPMMDSYFDAVYRPNEQLFFERCLFVCDDNDMPIGTCFAWKAYGEITTIHWFKVKKEYEGLGIGRALLSIVLKGLQSHDFPVYLHTQPRSFRAIKLYSDFGFKFLTDPMIGFRRNELNDSLPVLKQLMHRDDFEKIQFIKAPEHFLKVVQSSKINQF